ncbi:MAG TPA: hypothetical protein VJ464_30595 [Blastocatellia bacterium]|nr:hypothetical protein [Blastocatellia bacterium]
MDSPKKTAEPDEADYDAMIKLISRKYQRGIKEEGNLQERIIRLEEEIKRLKEACGIS